MKRRLILICSLAVVVALGAYVAYALVEGTAPFAKAPKAGDDAVLTAAAGMCHPDAQAAGAPGKCAHAGNCICPKGPGSTAMTAGKCQGAAAAGCAAMKSGACQGMATAGCQPAANGACPAMGGSASQSLQTGTSQAAAGCQAAKAAGMCSAKSACGSSCPMTK